MLACARIGAPHTVVFGGFSAEALSGRINDCGAKVLITADGGWRRGKRVGLKHHADEAVAEHPDDRARDRRGPLRRRRAHGPAAATTGGTRSSTARTRSAGRSRWTASTCSTCSTRRARPRKPKGILHTTAGYLLGAAFTHWAVFDIKPDDVYWCAADIGWVTGHSYIVYGPLANATTGILYEGAPDAPTWDRWWEIIEDYKVTILYCAPTAIRAFMKQGEEIPKAHDLSSLRVLGSVGEPINPEAWRWYKDVIGGDTTPVVDTWWQTETGQIMISPLPGVTTTKPGSATFALPGVDADVVDADGRSVPLGGGGYLVLKRPWPGMLRGIYGDPERFRADVLEPLPGDVLRRRRRQARRGGLPLAPGPRRRRDERGRPPDLHHRGGVGAGRPPLRRRGRRRRQDATRSPGRRSSRSSSSRPGRSRATRWRSSCASTSPTSSARSPGPSS